MKIRSGEDVAALWQSQEKLQQSQDKIRALDEKIRATSCPPVAQGDEASVAMEAWRNSRRYLTALYRHDDDLTAESIRTIRRSVEKQSRKLRLRFGRVLSPLMGS